MGIALLHQFNASSRTKRMICFLLAPMQRIMPKNFVLWETLLFMQLEIISTPAVRIIRNTAPAIGYRLAICCLVLAPASPKTIVFSLTFSSPSPYCFFKLSIAFFSFVPLANRT